MAGDQVPSAPPLGASDGVQIGAPTTPAATITGAEEGQRLHAAQLARAAARTWARDAEREAADTTRERDAADVRIRDALARAAQARAAADLDDDVGSHQSDLDADQHDLDTNPAVPDARAALLIHEAAALINLHAQAVAVQNIRALVPVVLDISTLYTRWRDSFLLVVGKYTLADHVLTDTFAPTSPDWVRMDCVVKSWIVGTITTDLADAVLIRDATARTAWLAIESQFLGNCDTWALFLDAEFRNFRQGDLSISDYCRKFKGMADALGDLGEPVHDRTLVLNVIRGLNERFANIGLHLRRG
jgi:hypothetical protein